LAGTIISPMLSRSMRVSAMAPPVAIVVPYQR